MVYTFSNEGQTQQKQASSNPQQEHQDGILVTARQIGIIFKNAILPPTQHFFILGHRIFFKFCFIKYARKLF